MTPLLEILGSRGSGPWSGCVMQLWLSAKASCIEFARRFIPDARSTDNAKRPTKRGPLTSDKSISNLN